MKVILEREANTELVAAAQYYDEEQPGLGSEAYPEVCVRVRTEREESA